MLCIVKHTRYDTLLVPFLRSVLRIVRNKSQTKKLLGVTLCNRIHITLILVEPVTTIMYITRNMYGLKVHTMLR